MWYLALRAMWRIIWAESGDPGPRTNSASTIPTKKYQGNAVKEKWHTAKRKLVRTMARWGLYWRGGGRGGGPPQRPNPPQRRNKQHEQKQPTTTPTTPPPPPPPLPPGGNNNFFLF